MLLATGGLWVTSGILWNCNTWIQFLFWFIGVFCFVAFFFFSSLFVSLSCQVIVGAKTALFPGRGVLESTLVSLSISCYTYPSLHPLGTVSRKGPLFCSACYRLCWENRFWHPLWSSILEAKAALGCSARKWATGLYFLAELLLRTICLRDWLCQCSSFRESILTLQVLWLGLGLSHCLHVCLSAHSYVLQM